jgi:hypothetical protein
MLLTFEVTPIKSRQICEYSHCERQQFVKHLMKTWVGTRTSLIIGLLGLAFSLPLQAGTWIFDNSANDLGTRFDPGTREVGDQIILAPGNRYLTYFDFEYWGVGGGTAPNTFAGTVEARVRFYENNALGGGQFHGYDTPVLTPFYESPWFGGFNPTGVYPNRATLTYSEALGDFDSYGGRLFIPASEITWTIQFRGMGDGDTVGVDIYSPPVTGYGADYPDYWENSGTDSEPNWRLLTNNVPMDFAARMYAEATIPEPSSLALALFGGLGMLAFARRLRRG